MESDVDTAVKETFSAFSTSGAPYVNNVVTFTASFNSTLLDNRILVGVGMVVQKNNSEFLFGHSYIPGYVKKPGEELLCHWSDVFI